MDVRVGIIEVLRVRTVMVRNASVMKAVCSYVFNGVELKFGSFNLFTGAGEISPFPLKLLCYLDPLYIE